MRSIDWMRYRLAKSLRKKAGASGKISYAQCGEDMIASFVFDALKIAKPSWLDIGAHHPSHLNNTYTFYERGARGINIEPDPRLFSRFIRERPGDTNLNIGIGPVGGELEFYVMSARTLNTFSGEEARAAAATGRVRIEQTIRLPVRPVNAVLAEHFPNSAPDLLSLDVEGLDIDILRSWDFSRWRPRIACVETITYSTGRSGRQKDEISKLFEDNEYFEYAHTHINTLFVDKEVWL